MNRCQENDGVHVIHTVGGIAERSGGPSRTVTSLCSSIGYLGVDIDLVAGIDRSADDRLILPDANSVNLQLVDVNRLGRLRYYPEFSRTLTRLLDKGESPVLIHDHGIWGHTNVAAWRVARSRSIPYVLSPRGMLEPWALEFKANKKKLAWLLYQRRIIESAAAIIATSEKECENVKRLFPKLPVAIIPNGVHLPDAVRVLSSKPQVKSGGTILFMSRIHPVKNLISLLHAWRLLPQIVAEGWRLVIAGPDESGHAREILSLVRELGLQDSVDLIGAVGEDQKAEVFQSADVFLLPSFTENFGLVVAEALSYGLPVIATTGTPWQELQNRGCGWWVEPTVDALTEVLREALNMDPVRLQAMGQKGREYAREFDWSHIARQTADVYRWVLGQGSMPGCIVHD